MEQTHRYEIDLQWDSGKKGTLSSPVLPLTIGVAISPYLHDEEDAAWSPGHLYLGTLTSCLMATFISVAKNSGLAFTDFKCNATATTDDIGGQLQIADVIIRLTVTIALSKDVRKSLRIISISKNRCLISNSVKTRIHIAPQVIVCI